MKNARGSALPDLERPSRPPAFTFAHLFGFLFCWFPANPVGLLYLSQFFHARFGVAIPNWLEYSWFLTKTILGPFTASLEGRNREHCLQTAFHLLPLCLGAVVLASMIQILWRPRALSGLSFRLFLWLLGWFIWFCGAIYSVLDNSG